MPVPATVRHPFPYPYAQALVRNFIVTCIVCIQMITATFVEEDVAHMLEGSPCKHSHIAMGPQVELCMCSHVPKCHLVQNG